MGFDNIQGCKFLSAILEAICICVILLIALAFLCPSVNMSASLSLPSPSPSYYSSPMTHLISQIATGLFNTRVQTHLLLMMNKASPEYEESMQRYREAAKLFQGQVG